MSVSWGLGPVFAYEWLTTSRRWQIYALRSLFVALLLAGIYLVWVSETFDRPNAPSIRQQAVIGEKLFYAIIGIQLAIVLLAAPAATAGAICLDKARGALTHLLVTDLSDSEIILGKLAARLVPVLGLVGCSLPLLFLSTLFGGISPEALSGAFLVTLGVAVIGCVLALTLSVWGTKTHEVLLITYMIWIVVILAYPLWNVLTTHCGLWAPPAWLLDTNPFWLAFAPYASPGSTGWEDVLGFVTASMVISMILLLVAILRVRSVTVRQAGQPPRKRSQFPRVFGRSRGRAWLLGPSIDKNPVLWREWHRRRPSSWARLVWVLYVILAITFSVITIVAVTTSTGWLGGLDLAAFVNGFQVAIGLLLMSVASVTSLAEERVRGSLEVLLVTPLPTRSIVWGKWWGAYRRVPLLAILPASVAAAVASHPGRWWGAVASHDGRWWNVVAIVLLVLAYGAAITSLGLALATWISRFGRAVAASVTAYVLVCVGWVFLIVLLFNGKGGTWVPGLACASPWFAPAFLIIEIRFPETANGWGLVFWSIFWVVVFSGAAVLFLGLTLVTFDWCLGRATPHITRAFPWPQRSTDPEAAVAQSVAGAESLKPR